MTRVPLPAGFRMFILPEYRLVTPTYSVKLSRSHGTILSALLANYDRYVLRSDIENILWGHREDGGPESASNTLSVTLHNIRAKFRSVGIDVTFRCNWRHRNDSGIKVSGLAECKPVGSLNNTTRLKALRDRQSPNPSRGLPNPSKAPMIPPIHEPVSKPSRQEPGPKRVYPVPEKPRYSYVEPPRLQAAWTHNARAEAWFGREGPR
jgi:hypothetical protein